MQKDMEVFIPWDDDIDIGMTRTNYNKFIEVSREDLSADFFLQTPQDDEESPFPYTKIRKNGTEFVEWTNRKNRMHRGIYVDVFPYDNIPNDEELRKKQFHKVQKLTQLYVYLKTPGIVKRPNKVGDYIKKYMWKFIYPSLKLLPSKRVLISLEKVMCKYNSHETTAKACLFFPEYMVESMNNNVLYPLKSIKFENIEVPAPNNLDEYLTTHYGDYMELPPLNERVGHKPYIVNLDLPGSKKST